MDRSKSKSVADVKAVIAQHECSLRDRKLGLWTYANQPDKVQCPDTHVSLIEKNQESAPSEGEGDREEY